MWCRLLYYIGLCWQSLCTDASPVYHMHTVNVMQITVLYRCMLAVFMYGCFSCLPHSHCKCDADYCTIWIYVGSLYVCMLLLSSTCTIWIYVGSLYVCMLLLSSTCTIWIYVGSLYVWMLPLSTTCKCAADYSSIFLSLCPTVSCYFIMH